MLIPLILISNLGEAFCIGFYLIIFDLALANSCERRFSMCKVCNTPCKPNHITGQIDLDLSVKSVLLTAYLIWFAGSVAYGIGQREIKDNEVKTNAECFLNYKVKELTYGHLKLWDDFHYGLP